MTITKLNPEDLDAPLVGGVIERPDVANKHKEDSEEEDKEGEEK